MYSITHSTPETLAAAPDSVREVFAAFTDGVPDPMQLLSASPFLLTQQFTVMRHFRAHPTLSFPLLAAIRYTVARSRNYACCTNFNETLLERCGMTRPEVEDLYAVASNDAPLSEAGLEDREQKLVRFVLLVVETPEAVTGPMLDDLRAEGWSDQDILEAVMHGANMSTVALVDRAFRLR